MNWLEVLVLSSVIVRLILGVVTISGCRFGAICVLLGVLLLKYVLMMSIVFDCWLRFINLIVFF